MDMGSSGADSNCGTNTARGNPFQGHNGVESNHQVNKVESYGEEQEDEAHHDVALHRNFTGRGLRNHSTGVADLGRPGRGFDLRGEDCPATDKQA